MSIYEELNVPRVINCAGKMTYLGSSVLREEVMEAMNEAGASFVSIDELMLRAGEKIAELCEAEAAMVTAGASAGIIAAVAGVITGGDPLLTEQVPHPKTNKRKVILQKGHAIYFSAPMTQMIAIGGGIPEEVGTVSKTLPYHIENSIDEDTAAIMYAQSHHAVQTDMVPLDKVIEIAHKKGVPVLVDAAAEEDMQKYVKMGADIVIYSGAKAFEGPTSGFIVGRKCYIEMCRQQTKGVCRAMKVGKESVAGLLKALMLYGTDEAEKSERQKEIVERLYGSLSGIDGLYVSISSDPAGRDIKRIKLTVNKDICGMDAIELDKKLKEGSPSIYTRDHHMDMGYLELDPRPMKKEECEVVTRKIKELLGV